jgi:hypothetical protein
MTHFPSLHSRETIGVVFFGHFILGWTHWIIGFGMDDDESIFYSLFRVAHHFSGVLARHLGLPSWTQPQQPRRRVFYRKLRYSNHGKT